MKRVVDERRAAKANSQFFVEKQTQFFLVIRVKGIRKVSPKEKKILRLFRLRQIGNAVFIRNNKATMNMLRRIEPWVTYGAPSRRVVRNLVYKRGFGTLNKQRIPLTSNAIVAEGLSKHGIKCMEDLVHEIWTLGENFKAVTNFLWPFKLNAPRGGFKAKRHAYLNNGTVGPRGEFINNLADRML